MKKAARPAQGTKKAKTTAKKKIARAPASRKAPRKVAPAARAPAQKPAPRADLGAPVDGFFARQPAALRGILDELRALVDEAAPEASSSLKWGMPFYEIDGRTVCALAAFKAHVNVILPGPPGTFADPGGLLEGDGKTGRHVKVRSPGDLPRAALRGWLRTAADRARAGK